MEQKERMNVRTRKALERERKKAKKLAVKTEFKRFVKSLFIGIAIVLAILVSFVVIEVIRFNSTKGLPPGIIRAEDYTEKTLTYTSVFGLYTIKYEYQKTFDEYKTASQLTADEIVSGEFRLFNKWLLSAWIK